VLYIWAEWLNGQVECVDSAESESESLTFINEYRMAYGSAAKRVWIQETGV